MVEWTGDEARAECRDLRVRVRELEAEKEAMVEGNRLIEAAKKYKAMCPRCNVDHYCNSCHMKQKRIKKLEAENERLSYQIDLMESKAKVSFNCFWNGGWYTIVHSEEK